VLNTLQVHTCCQQAKRREHPCSMSERPFLSVLNLSSTGHLPILIPEFDQRGFRNKNAIAKEGFSHQTRKLGEKNGKNCKKFAKICKNFKKFAKIAQNWCVLNSD
jgi:hypothetical protein